jgi:acylphosphatase
VNEINIPRLHAIVEGHVHGVGFRAFVIRRASSLGVTGWVRNRWDGTVEVVAEGERPDLDQLVSALQRGPASSRVTKVQTDWKEASGEFTRFSVKATV